MIMNHKIKFGSKLSYSDHMSPCCDHDLENSKQIFLHNALRLMMIHHNTKFGNKMLGSLEDIICKNNDSLTLCFDLDLECSNPIFFTRHTGL